MEEDEDTLVDVMTYHIVPSEQETCDLKNDVKLDTLASGQSVLIKHYSSVGTAIYVY